MYRIERKNFFFSKTSVVRCVKYQSIQQVLKQVDCKASALEKYYCCFLKFQLEG